MTRQATRRSVASRAWSGTDAPERASFRAGQRPRARVRSVGSWASSDRSTYERLRQAHVHAIRAALEGHVARLEWPREWIERYRTERLRALLAYARERSPFHARRMARVDPSA